MKKEKNEISTYDKEKNIKKFRIFEKIVMITEVIMIIGAILISISMVGVGISIVNDSAEETLESETTVEQYTEEGEWDFLDVPFKVLATIFAFMTLELLRRVFKETADKGTPFTEKNIKNIKNISTFSILCYIFLMKSVFSLGYLVFLAVIWSIEHIFRYGYELQEESDELI